MKGNLEKLATLFIVGYLVEEFIGKNNNDA